jgi:hypothetical protein
MRSDERGVAHFAASFSLSFLCVQACIAHRRKLESRLFNLQMAYDALKDEADFLRRAYSPDPSLSATLGSADAILVAVYLGGKVWRRFYGPLGPERSLDR